jgi:O-antigen/teichoic acid export membrane protein
VAMALRMASGVLTARVILPSVLGLFNGMGLVLGYAPFFQLGILNGLNRELPYFVGKGDQGRVRDLAAAAQAWAIAVGCAVAAALLAVSCWYALGGKWSLAAGWAATALGAWFLFYSQNYLQTTYRTRGDFARLAFVNVTTSSVTLALVATVWLFGFYGLCLRAAAVGLVELGLLWHWRPVRVRPMWNGASILHLLKVGAPIFGVGQLYAWWTVLDSTMVLRFEGVKGLGLYSLALMSGSALQLLPDSVSQILYPQMAEEYGRGGKLPRLLKIPVRPISFLLLGMIPLAVLGWIAAAPLVAWILPNYSAGVPAARWAMVAPVIVSFSPALMAFNVVRRQDLYALAMVAGIASYLGSVLGLRALGGGLESFPKAMAFGRLVFIGLCYLMLYRLAEKEGRTSPAGVTN